MTAQEIIDLALSNTHTKTGQVSATNLLTFFNLIRKEVGNSIISGVNENFFYEIWKRDAVAEQENGEYPYPVADEDSAGMVKALSVAIKGHKDDSDYTVAREVDIANLDYDWNYYLTTQSKVDPIYYIGEDSLFIAPQFVTADLPDVPAGNAQIKLNGIKKFIDITAEAEDSAILIPDDFQPVIALGMEQYIYKARGKANAAKSAKQEYLVEQSIMVDNLTNRDNSVMKAKLPDDTNLQYGE